MQAAIDAAVLHSLLTGTALSCVACALAPRRKVVPASLIVRGNVVDNANHIAFSVNQAGVKWSMAPVLGRDYTKYVEVDESRHTVYTVFIGRRRYSEQTAEGAAKYEAGLQQGIAGGGWKITRSDVAASNAPRKVSYRFVNEASLPNGVQATFIEHMTSPDNLYSIGAALPRGENEEEFQRLLRSVRITP